MGRQPCTCSWLRIMCMLVLLSVAINLSDSEKCRAPPVHGGHFRPLYAIHHDGVWRPSGRCSQPQAMIALGGRARLTWDQDLDITTLIAEAVHILGRPLDFSPARAVRPLA